MKMKEGKLREWARKMKYWTQKMKECKINPYLLTKKDISYRILPPSTIIMEDPIRAQLSGET